MLEDVNHGSAEPRTSAEVAVLAGGLCEPKVLRQKRRHAAEAPQVQGQCGWQLRDAQKPQLGFKLVIWDQRGGPPKWCSLPEYQDRQMSLATVKARSLWLL